METKKARISKCLVENRQAKFNYELIDIYEVGMVLKGIETKSILNGKVSLKESFVSISDNLEAFWKQGYINVEKASLFENISATRERKLLLHKKELKDLYKAITLKGYTLVPLNIHTGVNGKLKMDIALARGKKLYDKRESIKEREQDRIMKQAIKKEALI